MKAVYTILLFVCGIFFPSFAAEYTPFESTPMVSGSSDNFVVKTSDPGVFEHSGKTYSPFESTGWSQLPSQPVLYGPGGDPIGGLPVGEANLMLFGIAIAYAVFRLVRRRLVDKKKLSLLILLFAVSTVPTLHAQAKTTDFEAKVSSIKKEYIKMGVPEDMAETRARIAATQEMPGLRASVRNASPANGSIWIDREAPFATYTPEELVRNLFVSTGGSTCGTEGNVKNVTFIGTGWDGTKWTAADKSLLYFSHGTGTPLNINEGILLATGPALLAEGPNSTTGGLPNGINVSMDDDLKGLIPGYNVTSGSILEFDFIPIQSEISFDYVFASEEYPEYVASQYNDVFGFFISGPGIPNGKQNIALIPNTTTPVAINNVNDGHSSDNTPTSVKTTVAVNPQYYVPNYNNPAGTYMEYDGHTTVLTARATVIPGQTYHMKLAISNAGDNILGSGVFLKAGSFDLGLGITNYGNNIKGMDHVFAGCTNNKFVISMNPSTTARTIQLSYSGTNVNDLKQLNGSALPASVVIPANATEVEIPYQVLNTVTQNGGEFTVSASVPGCGNPWTKTIHVFSKVVATPVITPTCPGQSTGMVGFNLAGGSPFAQMSKDNGTTWVAINNNLFTNLPKGNVTILVRDSISCHMETFQVNVPEANAIALQVYGTEVCEGTPATLFAVAPSLTSPIFKWYTNSTKANLLYTGPNFVTPPLTFGASYYVEVSQNGMQCTQGQTVYVNVKTYSSPNDINVQDVIVCGGNSVKLTASSNLASPVFYWYTSQTSMTPIATGASFTTPVISTTTTYYVGVSDLKFCETMPGNRKPVTVTIANTLTAGTIDGVPGVCPNTSAGTIDGVAATGGSGNFTYKWQKSTDGTNWTDIANSNTQNYTVGNLSSSTYYRRVVTDIQCGSVYSNTHYIAVVPTEVYWSTGAMNQNWNDPANWVDANGNPLNCIPLACTNVHIPGNALGYPTLNESMSPRTKYAGEPVCNNITYHFGGGVAKPHYLTYNKAYIRYDAGYYDSNNKYVTGGDKYSLNPLARGRWYALAAPLKKIASGDFSFGGYPNTWQRGFRTTPEHTSDLIGEWYDPENTNALEIGAKQNYAISLWFGEYLPGVLGESDHKMLNGLKGVIEMPYFENTAASNLHRIHNYDGTTSRFSYYFYQNPNLDIATPAQKTPGSIVRGNEAYRFIFEDANNKAQETFTMTVPAGDDVMIGNPFISGFDFLQFYLANSTKMEFYYRLFENGTFITYNAQTAIPISPLQGFFIKTKGTKGQTVQLTFSSNSMSMSLGGGSNVLKSPSSVDESLIHIQAKNDQGMSHVFISMDGGSQTKDVPQLFIKDEVSDYIPQLYLLDGNNKKLAIESKSSSEFEVPFGIKSVEETMIELSVPNAAALNVNSLILYDKEWNKKIDLLENPRTIHRFTYNPARAEDRFVLIVNKNQAPTAIDGVQSDDMKIYVIGKTLYVESDNGVRNVTVTSTQGIRVVSDEFNSNEYSKELQLPAGVYIVTARLSDGSTKTEKIILN